MAHASACGGLSLPPRQQNPHRLKRAPLKGASENAAEENLKIVITDYRFPDVDQERRAVEAAGGTLVTGQAVNEEQVAELCRDADGVLNGARPRHEARDFRHAALPHHRALRNWRGHGRRRGGDRTRHPRGERPGLLPRRSFRPRAHASAHAQPPDDFRDCAGPGRHLGRRENAAAAAIARPDLRPRSAAEGSARSWPEKYPRWE